MDWTTIAVTAALLALQAVVLSLLHGGSAQAEVVYHCAPGDYRAQPCPAAKASERTRIFKDDRTEAQLSQALSQRPKSNDGDSRAPASSGRAVALSGHRSGMAPFQNGRTLSDANPRHEPARRTWRKMPRARDDAARRPKPAFPI